jgi:hypothetical protein
MKSIAMLCLLVAVGCDDRTSPPVRTSPEVSVIGDSAWLGGSVRSRGGVTFGLELYTSGVPLERYDAGGGRTTVYASVERTVHAFCVIDEDAGAVAIERDEGGTAIEIFEAGAVIETRSLSDVLGRVTDAFRAACAARSTDDVWVFAQYDATPGTGSLAHWDGVEWTREEVEIPYIVSRSIAVTDGHVWLANGNTIVRRPLAGGAFETIDVDGQIVSSSGGRIVVLQDLFDPPEARVLDDASATPRLVGGNAATAVLDGSGEIWTASIESDGESRTSFGGSTTTYYPWWVQLVVADANDAEVAHGTIVIPDEDSDYDLLHPVFVTAGAEVALIWRRDVYLVPR